MGRFALVIGNSEYQDPKLARLVAPGGDATDLAEVLSAPEIGGFDEVHMLVNKSAPEVRRSVARFFTEKKPDDLLLLYFSGHGVRDDRGLLYLAVQDTEYDLLNATAIPAAFVTDEMDRSRSRRQVLVLDCCHSGAFSLGAKGATGEGVGTGAAFEGTGFGRMVLTATDATQFAWEGDQLIGAAENSVFTHHLVEGLRTGQADGDGDGRITLDELYEYVYEQVVQATPKQTPRKFTYNQQGDVVIAQNLRPVLRPAELPAELRQAIESPYASVRETAVRELERLLRGSHRGLALAAFEALDGLAADDSRRVSQAASAALDASGPAQPLSKLPTPAPPAEAQSHALEQAEAENRALEAQAAEARPAPWEADRNARANEAAQRLAAEQVQPEPAAAEPGEEERAASLPAQPAPAESAIERPPSEPVAGQASRPATGRVVENVWLPVALGAIGWALALALSGVTFNYLYISADFDASMWIANLLGGCVLGLAMSVAVRLSWPLRRRLLLALAGLWAVAWVLGGWAAIRNIYQTNNEFASWLIGNAVTAALGGAGTAYLLARHLRRSVLTRPFVVIWVSWIVVGIVSFWVVFDALRITDFTDFGLTAPGLIVAALTGAIGSGVMLWQLGKGDVKAD